MYVRRNDGADGRDGRRVIKRGRGREGGREEQRHGQREEATRPCGGNRKGWMERREGGREERQDQGKQDSENK